MHNKTILSLSLAFFSRGANRPIWSDPVDNWTAIGLKLTVFGSCIPQLWLRGSVIGTFKLSHKIKYCEEINTLIDLQINLIIPLPSPDQTILRWPPLLTQYNSLQVARDTILCAPSEHLPWLFISPYFDKSTKNLICEKIVLKMGLSILYRKFETSSIWPENSSH